MKNFLLLGVCILLGVLLRTTKRLSPHTPEVLNGFVWHISLPALVLIEIHRVTLSSDFLFSVGAPWLLFAFSIGFCAFMGKVFRWDRKVIGTLILMSGLANTSFVGFPMLEALYGPSALKVGMWVDQLGSFPVLCTLGLGIASLYSGRRFSFRKTLSRIFSFPPIYALIVAVILRPVQFPEYMNDLLTKLGATVSPLALVAVGYQLRVSPKVLRSNSSLLTAGLFFKLFLGPALLTLIYVWGFHAGGDTIRVTLAETAMAPMITGSVLVMEYGLDAELAVLMLGLGIPLSFITVPLWVNFLQSWA